MKVWAILNNKIHELYVSHIEKVISYSELESFEEETVVCGYFGTKIKKNSLKSKRAKGPRILIPKTSCLFEDPKITYASKPR